MTTHTKDLLYNRHIKDTGLLICGEYQLLLGDQSEKSVPPTLCPSGLTKMCWIQSWPSAQGIALLELTIGSDGLVSKWFYRPAALTTRLRFKNADKTQHSQKNKSQKPA